MTPWQKRKGSYFMLIGLLIAVFLAGLIMRASTNRNSFILAAANKSLANALHASALEAPLNSYSLSSNNHSIGEPYYTNSPHITAQGGSKNAENLEMHFISSLNSAKGMPPFLITNVSIQTTGNRLSYAATIVYPGFIGNRSVYFEAGPLIPQKKIAG